MNQRDILEMLNIRVEGDGDLWINPAIGGSRRFERYVDPYRQKEDEEWEDEEDDDDDVPDAPPSSFELLPQDVVDELVRTIQSWPDIRGNEPARFAARLARDRALRAVSLANKRSYDVWISALMENVTISVVDYVVPRNPTNRAGSRSDKAWFYPLWREKRALLEANERIKSGEITLRKIDPGDVVGDSRSMSTSRWMSPP